MTAQTLDTVIVEHDGAITIVSINRPERRNAVDAGTARRLHDVFLAFDADASASVAVFTGTGGTFCAGANLVLVLLAAQDGDWDQLNSMIHRFQQMNMKLKYAAKPVVAGSVVNPPAEIPRPPIVAAQEPKADDAAEI